MWRALVCGRVFLVEVVYEFLQTFFHARPDTQDIVNVTFPQVWVYGRIVYHKHRQAHMRARAVIVPIHGTPLFLVAMVATFCQQIEN